nr:hypothetical protein [Tanacetum cinerariifolium]
GVGYGMVRDYKELVANLGGKSGKEINSDLILGTRVKVWEMYMIAKLTHAVNQQTSAVTTAMTTILKQFQVTPPPASVKAVEEICVTCVGAHPYYQCLAIGGNIFLKLRDNIQGYVLAAAVNYNQGNSVYRPPVEDERVEETLTDQDLAGYTIKVPPPFVQKSKPPSQRDFVMHQRDPHQPNIPYPSRMLKQKQQEKDEV